MNAVLTPRSLAVQNTEARVNLMSQEEIMSYFKTELDTMVWLAKRFGANNPRVGSTSWSFGIVSDDKGGCVKRNELMTWTEARKIVIDKITLSSSGPEL